jgi:hypothetical protein
LTALVDFARSGYQIVWTHDKAISAITAYLSNYGIDCLRAYFGKSAIPIVTSTKNATFVVNAFIRHAQESNAILFEGIVQLVEGQMLANALLCPDIAASSETFSRLTIFLDTPLLLRVLDLDDESTYQAAKETIDLCRSLGSRVAVFSHTATEVYGVIKFCAMHLDDPLLSKGQLLREMRKRRITQEELILQTDTLDLSFSNLDIDQIESPPHDPAYEIDEKILDISLEDEINYMNPRARQFDVDSIRAIYTMRSGKRPRLLEQSVAVLVTTNAALARSAYVFGQRFESSREVSTVISSFSLANIAWLRGRKLTTELPRIEMMAMAYAALRPSDALWDKFILKSDRLRAKGYVRPSDHAIIRFSPAIQRDLMNLTLGDEDRLTDATVYELVEKAEAEILREERELRMKEHVKYEQYAEAKESELVTLEGSKQALLQSLSAALDAHREILHRTDAFATRVGVWVRWVCLVVSAGLYLLLAYGVSQVFAEGSRWKTILNLLFLVLTAALVISGQSPNGWSRRLGVICKKHFFKWVEKRYIPPIDIAGQKLLSSPETATQSREAAKSNPAGDK